MRALKWAMGIVAGLVAAVVLAMVLVPWGRAAPWLSRYASTLAGREVVIGELAVDWGWTPHVTLRDIRVANADWASDRSMATISELRVAVRLPPLLRGRLELPEVAVREPWVLLEKNREGQANWRVRVDPAEPVKPDKRQDFPVIRRLSIDGGTLVYKDAAKQVDVKTRVSTVMGEGESRTVQLEGDGTLERKPLKLTLTAASLLELREGDEPYPVDLDLRAGDTRFTAAGTFRDPVRLEGADLKIRLAGRDLGEIFPLFGIPTPKTAPYSLAGQLRRDRGLWQVDELAGKVGDSDLSGRLSYDDAPERPLVKADLTSRQLRMKDLGGFIGYNPGEEDAVRSAAGEGRVVPATQINVARMKAADMEIRLRSGSIDAPGLPIQALDARLDLKDGRAVLDPLALKVAIGTVAGKVALDARPRLPTLAVDLDMSGMKLKPFFAGTRFEAETDGTLAGHVELAGEGRSFTDMAATADGKVALFMAGGQFSTLLMEATNQDLFEALGFLAGKDKSTRVRCIVADVGVDRGVAQSRALVFDTGDTNVTGDLRVDLASERIRGRLTAHPKDPSPLAVKSPVVLSGTLGDPGVGLDGGQVAARTGAAVALGALLTPLAALLPMIELGLGKDSPCGALIEEARREDPAVQGRAGSTLAPRKKPGGKGGSPS